MRRDRQVFNKTASFTAAASESGSVYILDTADLTVTLPAGETGLHYWIIVRALSSGTGAVVDGNGAETINGSATLTNTGATDALGDGMFIAWDGAEWVAMLEGTWA